MDERTVERTWVLDGGAGWAGGVGTPLVCDGDRAITLQALPGRAESIAKIDDAVKDLLCPDALAGNPRHGIFVLDTAASAVFRLSLRPDLSGDRVWVERLTTLGGVGHERRRFRKPRGIAVLPSGALAVADTGNHRVQLFSPPPYALISVWGATDRHGPPTAGTGPGEFQSPWAIAADDAGALYVLDRGNRRVQKIASDRNHIDDFGAEVLQDPSDMAAGPDGMVAVVDQKQRVVWVFSPRWGLPRLLAEANRPTSVVYAPDGTLYVGDQTGRLHVYVVENERIRLVGSGVTGLDGRIAETFWWDGQPPRLFIVVPDQSDRGRLRIWYVDPAGGRAVEGTFVTRPLDSAIERCQWHRVQVSAAVPNGTSIEIDSATSENKPETESAPSEAAWTRSILAGYGDPQSLVQSEPGRYLWLRVKMRSDGRQAPVLRQIKLSYPRTSYVQYLPAVYQEQEDSRRFLERFLSIFQTGFDDLDAKLDQVTDLLDPYRAPANHLRWLAAMVGLVVDPKWPERKLRDQIKGAVQAYRRRGTAAGLSQAIETYADVANARILEHFRLRRWPELCAAPLDGTARLWSRDFYQRLQVTSYSQVGRFRLTSRPEPAVEPLDWGADRFSVFFQADPYTVDETRDRVSRVVEREKPAHTEARLCPVFPRLRVGVQASVGVDTAVGAVSYAVLNRLATLNYDSILACSREEQTLRAMGSATRPQIGATTRLS